MDTDSVIFLYCMHYSFPNNIQTQIPHIAVKDTN